VDPLLCFPDPLPSEVALALDRAGYAWKAVDRPELVRNSEPEDGWAGALICANSRPGDAFSMCRHLRSGDDPLKPLVLVVGAEQLGELGSREDLFDDFCLIPLHGDELGARFDRLLRKAGRGSSSQLIKHGPLLLNLETYQAAVSGRVMDLTYMEYELLRFLAARPGKVFTRETLLNRVWGYEYYGGARTVDVHVRRLRAKLGEENAYLIQTVRSVGYRLSQGNWTGSMPAL
jgi:DNA-binding response OmpR family regulator